MMLASPLVDGDITLECLDASAVNGPYLDWMKDAEITKFLESRFSSQNDQSLREFIEHSNNAPQILLAGIFHSGSHVGNIKLSIDPHHKRGEIGILIGDKSVWGQGVGRRAIALLADHAFTALGTEKLSAGCYEGNVGSIRAFEAAGFTVEAVRKRHYIEAGRRIDSVHLARFSPTLEGRV